MKLKNVSLVERHIEKSVLALFVLVSLVVAWRYLVADPYVVEIRVTGQRQSLRPDEVEPFILEEAEKLDQRVRSETNRLPEMPVPEYTENFRRRVRQRVVEIARFDVPLGLPGLKGFDIGPGGFPDYHVPEPPAPGRLATRAGYGSLLAPEDPDLRQSYETLVGEERPLDFRYVSVGAKFSFEQWRRRLRAPAEPGLDRIPEDWWRNMQSITHVELERRAWDPEAGAWTEPVRIDPLPGDEGIRTLPERVPAEEAVTYVNRIRSEQEKIVRPEFPEVRAGRPWLPPDPAVAEAELDPSAQREYYELAQEIRALEQKIQEREAPAPASGEFEGGLYEEMAPSRGRSTDRRRAPERGGRQEAEPEDDLESQLETLRERQAALIGRSPRETSAGQDSARDDETFTIDEALVWAHDLTAEPGRRYQYRIRVGVINPLFRRSELSPDQRETYLDLLSLRSQVSDWSEPVELDPEHFFFVTRTNRQQRTATLEVWRVFDGQWRRESFTAAPGDPVGGVASMEVGETPVQVDMEVDALVVDVLFDVPAPGVIGDRTSRLLYHDLATDMLRYRQVAHDVESPTRYRLQAESMEASQTAAR